MRFCHLLFVVAFTSLIATLSAQDRKPLIIYDLDGGPVTDSEVVVRQIEGASYYPEWNNNYKAEAESSLQPDTHKARRTYLTTFYPPTDATWQVMCVATVDGSLYVDCAVPNCHGSAYAWAKASISLSGGSVTAEDEDGICATTAQTPLTVGLDFIIAGTGGGFTTTVVPQAPGGNLGSIADGDSSAPIEMTGNTTISSDFMVQVHGDLALCSEGAQGWAGGEAEAYGDIILIR
jgi:hypothetical protein